MNTVLNKYLNKECPKARSQGPRVAEVGPGQIQPVPCCTSALAHSLGRKNLLYHLSFHCNSEVEDSKDQRALTAQPAFSLLRSEYLGFPLGDPLFPRSQTGFWWGQVHPLALDGGHICQLENSSWHGHGLQSRPVRTLGFCGNC